MSKKNQQRREPPEELERVDDRAPTDVHAPDDSAIEQPAGDGKPNVKKHLQCPACWNGLGGKAERRKWSRQVHGTLQQRCYVCDECGAEWVVDVRSDVVDDIEHVSTKISRIRYKTGEDAPSESSHE